MLMKSSFISKMLFAMTALIFVALSCFAQNKPPEQLVGTWSKKIESETMNVTLTLTFKSDFKSEVEFTGDDVTDVFSDYEISGSRITFND